MKTILKGFYWTVIPEAAPKVNITGYDLVPIALELSVEH